MSRPYPVGEKMAGHKLASLYIIMLAGCTKVVCTGKLGTAANACALQDGLTKDPRRRVGLYLSSCVTSWSLSTSLITFMHFSGTIRTYG